MNIAISDGPHEWKFECVEWQWMNTKQWLEMHTENVVVDPLGESSALSGSCRHRAKAAAHREGAVRASSEDQVSNDR